MIRLVATDLDGTLLRDDLSVSERTRRAIARAREAGIDVIPVTARQPHGMRDVAAQAGLTGEAICSNGAVTYHLGRDEVTDTVYLDGTTIRDVGLALRARLPGLIFAGVRDGGRRFLAEAAYAAVAAFQDHKRHPHEMEIATLDKLSAEPCLKFIVRHPDLTSDALLAEVRALGLAGFEATHSRAPFVEVLGVGVSKAAALERLCARRGLARHEVLALGDGPNDLPMLAWAGRAVAPATAHPEVLAAVREVTASNDEDGVAQVLEALVAARPTPA